MKKLLNQAGAIHTIPLLTIIVAIGIISYLLIASTAPAGGLFGLLNPKPQSKAASPCQFQKADQPLNIAFCDSFDIPNPNPAGTNTRSGELDGVAWGVSRVTSDDNNTQNRFFTWNPSTQNLCGTSVTVFPERDIQICNGKLVESASDQGQQTVVALYPKQPFDFTGRTGTVVFDVGNDTQGSHMAWPEFVISDQPVPAPHESGAGLGDYARNSVGISFAQDIKNGQGWQPQPGDYGDSWTVDKMWFTQNYMFHEVGPTPGTPNPPNWSPVGSVKKAVAGGPMNHVEIRLSANHVDVWATDPGSTVLKLITTADFPLPLTRGLVWMEDVHYNADKEPGTQGDHAFAWDNFGFDGPYTYRDLTFDVLDANHTGTTRNDIGWSLPVTGQGSVTLQIPGVYNVQKATAAYLLFTFYPHQDTDITYSVNGNPNHVFPWPFGNTADITFFRSQTLAVPVPLNEVVSGTNTVKMSANDVGFGNGGSSVANVDLLLVAAGDTPCSLNPSQPCNGSPIPTPTPTPTTIINPTPTPTSAPGPTPTAAPTPTSTPTPQTGSTLGNTHIGSATDNGDENEMDGSKFTMGSTAATVNSMSVHVSNVDPAPNNQYQLAIYTDNNGVPDSLVAQSGIGSLAANAWNTLPVSASLSAGTSYWLVYNSNGTTRSSNNMNFDDGGSAIWSKTQPFGSVPQTFSVGGSSSSTFSIFATLGSATPPVVTPPPTPAPTPTGSLITITAAGQSAAGVNPNMTLAISGANVKTWSVGGNAETGSFLTFTYSSASKVTHSQIRVKFTNDYYNPALGQDRNLRVSKVNIDGVDFPSSAPSVFSVGSWTPQTGCAGGNKQTEWLLCNGYFQY